MNERNIGYTSINNAEMPKLRVENDILKNLAPGNLPTELDYALSSIVIRRMK